MPKPSLLALALVVAASSGACYVLWPRLEPHDPPENQVDGLLLVSLPAEVLEEVAVAQVRETRDAAFAGADPPGPEVRAAIEAHQILTGMTERDVVFAFLSHATRVDRQGPPGGLTLLWDEVRYWVRFDDEGLARAAGRH